MPKLHKFIIIFSLLLIAVSLPATAATQDCRSSHDIETEKADADNGAALRLKVVAMVSVLVAGVVGVSFPILGQRLAFLCPDNDIFFMIKAFAGGVILATGFVHILPDAFRTLTSPCLGRNPWAKFPFSGFIAMAASIGTLMVDTMATAFYKSVHLNKEVADEEADGGENEEASELVRQRIISQVLEVGIVVHSLIIGISLGASKSSDAIKPLIIALSLHQFFEGMGLGGCISQAKYEWGTMTAMTAFFSVTAPVGVGIGMGICSVYEADSGGGVAVEGALCSASAGILIYMALVDILAADFMSSRMEKNPRLQLGAYVSLLLGAGSMSFLAKWA